MDKELALIISEMHIKQDETTAQIRNLVVYAKATNDRIDETNAILRDFMGVSIKQWEQQQIFNETIVTQLKEIKVALADLVQLEARLKAVEERESNFELRLANIERMLKAS